MKNKSNLIIFIIIIILAILLIWPAFKGPADDATNDESDVTVVDDQTASSTSDTSVDVVDVSAVKVDDNSTVDKIVIKPVETGLMTVKAFFSSTEIDPNNKDCSLVYPASRQVARTSAVARVALMELFKGLTSSESANGLATAINPGVKINSLTINNGLAKIDLSKELGDKVAGSCRVTAIRSQITQTLKQFPTVSAVLISIDGKMAGVLQP